MRKKRVLSIVIMVLLITQLASCGFHSGNKKEYKTPGQKAEELQAKIMDCFVTKDKETLKGFFSKYTLEQCPEIEEQMEEAFTFLDGAIVSYDAPDGDAAGSFDDKSYSADTDHILTDQGTEYRIDFVGNLTCLEDDSKVGVLYIKVAHMAEVDPLTVEDWSKYIKYIGTGY